MPDPANGADPDQPVPPTPSPLLRAKDIFLAVRGLPLPQRDDEVVRLCGGDSLLRGMVEGLLAGEAAPLPFESLADDIVAARDVIAPTVGPGSTTRADDSQLGSRIGRYRVLEKIGEGGFGVVYMAEQEEPVRRRVALKILKLGMDTRQIVARFEAERQALAMMDHPGIAKVHDAGATPAGRPFFVMELCAGRAITEFCDARHLSVRQRLELFGQVCQAVQHAHQKGLIHRDIKPSNILVAEVDGRPLAKVIDFGIAKATQARLTEKTLFTENRQLIGTPEYMSPEQAEGSLDIDTRTDVYSLGVLLYELLTGSTPFSSRELRSAAFAEIQRIIREVEPPRPSTRLSQNADSIAGVAANRSVEPRRLGTLMRGELDWIVMKSLEKDRRRRYAAASDLAADVERFLADQPVLARPATRLYKLGKFARRNKLAVTAGAAIALALLAGLAATTAMYVRADRARALADTQRQRAERESAKARAINSFLVEDMLAAPNPWEGGGRDVTVAGVLDKAAAQAEQRFADAPEVESVVRRTLADSYRALGLFREADPHYRRALELQRRAGSDGDTLLADTLRAEAANINHLGRPEEAEPIARDALARHTTLYGADSIAVAQSLEVLTDIQTARSQYKEAEQSVREALRIVEAAAANQDRDVMRARLTNTLGTVQMYLGDFKQAEATKLDALRQFRDSLSDKHPYAVQVLNDLGTVTTELERYDDTKRYYEEALPILVEQLGPEHQAVIISRRSLANSLSFLGRNDEAEMELQACIDIDERVRGELHPDTMATINSLATLYLRTRRHADAAPLLRSLHDRSTRSFGAGHAETLKYASNLAWAETKLGNHAEAESLFRQSFTGFEASLGRTHPYTIDVLDSLAQLLDTMKRWPEAAAAVTDVIARMTEAGQPEDLDTARLYNRVGTSLLSAGNHADALKAYQRSYDLCKKLITGADFRMAMAQSRLGEVQSLLGTTAEGEANLLAAVELCRADPDAHKPTTDGCLRRLMEHYERTGQTSKAAAIREQLPPPAVK